MSWSTVKLAGKARRILLASIGEARLANELKEYRRWIKKVAKGSQPVNQGDSCDPDDRFGIVRDGKNRF